jgi:Ca2+/Na+ antiporter
MKAIKSADLCYTPQKTINDFILYSILFIVVIILLTLLYVLKIYSLPIRDFLLIIFLLLFFPLIFFSFAYKATQINKIIQQIKTQGKVLSGTVVGKGMNSSTTVISHGKYMGDETFTTYSKYYNIEYFDDQRHKKTIFSTPTCNIKNPEQSSCTVYVYDIYEYAEN